DGLQRIGCRDEENLRQIERQIEVIVAEGEILGGVQDLQESGRGVASKVAAQLVDFVEHQKRIVDAGATNRLDDAPPHRADVSAAMATQFGLVMQAAETQALELAAQGTSD